MRSPEPKGTLQGRGGPGVESGGLGPPGSRLGVQTWEFKARQGWLWGEGDWMGFWVPGAQGQRGGRCPGSGNSFQEFNLGVLGVCSVQFQQEWGI